MSEQKDTTKKRVSEISNPEKRRRIERLRAERRRRQRRTVMITRGVIVAVLALVLFGCVLGIKAGITKSKRQKVDEKTRQEQQDQQNLQADADVQSAVEHAKRLAFGYDYDGAIKLLKEQKDKASKAEIEKLISEYEATKGTLKEADVDTIPHVFFHILVADPAITWNLSGADEYKIGDYNQVMTTIDEFKGILQQMYDRGFVLVKLHDLVEETKDENGNSVFTKGKIMLPEGKKPFVMSQDDVCYYFYMAGDGYATKMVVGEDGRLTTEYTTAEGTTQTGSYDLVPLLNDFLDEHPDFSYQGAKAALALTGYNGVLGYRTDPDLAETDDKVNSYAEEYGTFNVEEEIKKAKPVVEALKNDGWELASHSYGHTSYGSDFMKVKEDADKWQQRVANVIGPSDILILPFGTDIGGWDDYTQENEKYVYLKEQGFRFFCNVDSNPYWVQIRPEYVRQGRRNLDGYRMYQDLYNGAEKLKDLFDVQSVFDSTRPETGLKSWDGA